MCLCVSMVMHEKEGQPSSHPPLALHSPHLCINRSLFSHAPPPHLLPHVNGVWGEVVSMLWGCCQVHGPLLANREP